ncbi:MAG: hypothetical protein R6V01_03595 [Thermoplasmatota archaeon]
MVSVEEAVKELDQKMAVLLLEPSSRTALSFIRAVDVLRTKAEGIDETEALRSLHDDSMELEEVLLTLETDPEIVKRNLLARIISAVFPVLNSVEEFGSLEEKGIFEIFTDSLGIISEIATSTQYLEGTRLSAAAHLEADLVKVEARFVDLALVSGGDPAAKIVHIQSFMDHLRERDMPSKQKPFLPFLLWTVVLVLAYKKVKDLMKV